jgi:glutamyl-tRNA synthetase
MNTTVRVRYAPSPTGEPHLGSVRTALFNWLYARGQGGSFIVRIEDTDQERLVPTSVASLIEGLLWLGLDWDEGPTDDGRDSKGAFGPYFQSQRLPLYHQHSERLVASGSAYRCFCSPARLDAIRRAQQQQKLPPGYDRLCRDLPDDERRRRLDSGEPSVVRFRVPLEGATTVHDLVRGEVTWENRLLDDFIILKSDTFPTYHLASVVDDHLMRISHVMRAEEWLPSTPRHLLIYQAFGWQPPQFAHLPLILGADRSKLSKRHGATSVREYKTQGYLPDAMLNFLTLLGWSLDDKTDVISRADLVRNFSLERITKAAAIFNAEKLTWMNGVYVRAMSPQALAEEMLPFLERPEADGGLPNDVPRPLDRSYLLRIVPLAQERLKLLSESAELTGFFFQTRITYDPSLLVQKGMDAAATANELRQSSERLAALSSWDAATLEGLFRPLADELGLKTGQLFGAVRVAVTGRTATPPLFQTMEALGRERCMARLSLAIDSLKP